MMAEATDGREAAAAVEAARRRLDRVRAREAPTRRLRDRLERHLEVNHFSERLDIAFEGLGRDREEP